MACACATLRKEGGRADLCVCCTPFLSKGGDSLGAVVAPLGTKGGGLGFYRTYQACACLCRPSFRRGVATFVGDIPVLYPLPMQGRSWPYVLTVLLQQGGQRHKNLAPLALEGRLTLFSAFSPLFSKGAVDSDGAYLLINYVAQFKLELATPQSS